MTTDAQNKEFVEEEKKYERLFVKKKITFRLHIRPARYQFF